MDDLKEKLFVFFFDYNQSEMSERCCEFDSASFLNPDTENEFVIKKKKTELFSFIISLQSDKTVDRMTKIC